VKGTNAVFTPEDSFKKITVPVKIENAKTKFDDTVVETVKNGDVEQIKAIDLGGSETKLDFE
jgi:hypothetical protein